jgi:putative PIN family toxin of toxin-antitoxin system
MISAVLDVNVLVSAVIGPLGHSRRALVAWQDQRFVLLTSEGVIRELEEKLRLDSIVRRFRLTDEDAEQISRLLRTQATLVAVETTDQVPVTGDPEDDHVLATARLGKADYLVTGDRGLLRLSRHESIAIVSPREFLEVLSK